MLDILKSYLSSEDYYIIILKDRILIKNYTKIFEISDTYILIDIQDTTYKITGYNFALKKTNNKDLEITGIFGEIEKI